MIAFELQSVEKQYAPGLVALEPLSLQLAVGETLAILGPSGSGKSTLIRLIAGLETLERGSIQLHGQRIDRQPPHQRDLAWVPQRPTLYPQLTVADNLRLPPGSTETAVQSAAEQLRLTPLLKRYPQELSGGEKQRVILARLLIRPRSLWLLDEPFSSLDPVFREEFRQDLHLLARRFTATMIIVTHDPIDALSLGHRIGVLERGKLRQLGTAEELRSRPFNLFVALALGQQSIITGIMAGGDPDSEKNNPASPVFVSDCGSVRIPVPERLVHFPPNTPLTLGLRPENVVCWSPELSTPHPQGWEVLGWSHVSAEPVGSGWLLSLARGQSRIRAEWRSGSPPPVGAILPWIIPTPPDDWFDPRTGQRL